MPKIAEPASSGNGNSLPPGRNGGGSGSGPAPSSKLEHALALAERGFLVFPVAENAKAPPIKGWQQLATTNVATITAWWTETPNANIGVSAKDMLIADLDPRKGGFE